MEIIYYISHLIRTAYYIIYYYIDYYVYQSELIENDECSNDLADEYDDL